MWERIGSITNGYALYKRTMTHDGERVTVFRCSTEHPSDDEFGGYLLASSALRQKGL